MIKNEKLRMRLVSFAVKLSLVVLVSLFLSSCLMGNIVEVKNFDYTLRGTWESEPGSEISGTLEIGFDTIRITGYPDGIVAADERPFRDIPRISSFAGYSEGGKIFILYGSVYEYSYTLKDNSPSFPRDYFLEFTFGVGERLERLVKK